MTSSAKPTDAADQALDAALRGLHREVLAEPLPAGLRESAQRLARLQQQTANTRHWGGMAAGVLLAFSVGWLSHGQLGGRLDNSAAAQTAKVEREFVRQAGFAYAAYMPEKRHPVEVAAPEQEHLVQWLSKRLGTPVSPPKLGALGYELVGGRLLPGNVGPVAQFMYQDATGQRMTLYVTTENAAKPETGFRFAREAQVNVFYWVDGKFGYALSAAIDKGELAKVATAVYDQLEVRR